MLELGKDWRFPIDEASSKVWLTPKGAWGLSIRCQPTKVKVDGAFEEEFAPRLLIDDLDFMGEHWHDLVGMEVAQHGAWHGDGDPSASLVVEQRGDLREATVQILRREGTSLEIAISAECDVFLDDDHDKDVPLQVTATIPFEGVRFRFRADGLDSREPARKAVELLSRHLMTDGFAAPEIEPLTEPGVFTAFFPPADDGGPPTSGEIPVDTALSPEERVLHQSARELLEGMIRQEWIELEDGGADKLVPGFVEVLEMGGRGHRRANRVSEWLIDQDEVIDLHVNDEDLGTVLDKFW